MALNPVALHCESPIRALHKIHMSSFSTTDTTNTMWSAVLCVRTQLLASWTCYSLFLLCPPPTHGILCCHVVLSYSSTFGNILLPESDEIYVRDIVAALLVMEATRCSNYALILEGLLWHTQDHWIPTFQ